MKKNFIVLSTIIGSLTHKLSLSVLVVASLAAPSWGEQNQAEIVGNPQVNDDRVTVRVQVTNAENRRPIIGLQENNFKLVVDNKEFKFLPRDWKSPEESSPPPAWVVVLLDYSGSMNRLDSTGKTRFAGAISAVSQFVDSSSQRGGNTQISIVPFGVGGSKCQDLPVNPRTLDRFYPASHIQLQNYLDYLGTVKPCAATNLYEPIKEAVRFLGNEKDPRFEISENSSQPQPRLSIILLSDGFHNQGNEKRDFESLKSLFNRYSHINVHTLGYGLTPAELGKKYNLGRAATRADIGTGAGKVPEDEFVDQQRLKEIADLTGGVAEFSGNATSIAENLQLFLNALLGEYEITYTQPNAERGKKHQVQVVVNVPGSEKPAESDTKDYRITVFGRSLPGVVRLTIFILTLGGIGLAGVVPFYFWGKYLKEQALET
ncbi:vWA domain-containing protein [Anabaenopsis arnoldii]|uniref:VWA domain-containing protein n=1 Tax=Anabaenopsis arnoldii TaxID=2152938 RepID=A0ABT5AUA1_9CYAN|nr:vWA domain-containing protein [Anabaenopsis arnoldii]MDB9540884.1 VWA domain-containing protein [Anabaenopsis arnoldii]MDH6093322.1 VWA domain-containing protein [Anabaenopsis arnoldii]